MIHLELTAGGRSFEADIRNWKTTEGKIASVQRRRCDYPGVEAAGKSGKLPVWSRERQVKRLNPNDNTYLVPACLLDARIYLLIFFQNLIIYLQS